MLRTSLSRSTRLLQTRSIWTCSTLTASTPTSLLSLLAAQPNSSSTTLYALSKNVPESTVNSIRSSLPNSIGTLSEILPSQLSTHPYSLSLATFSSNSKSESIIQFRSELIGRPNIQVGREIKTGPRKEEGEIIDSGFEKFLRGEDWGFGEAPGMGRRVVISELEQVREQVKEVVFLAADRLQPFLTALSSYGNATSMGLVGSSTPFHTSEGRAFSLFKGNETFSDGAIGIAIIDSQSKAKELVVDYAGMEVFGGKAMEVTQAKGNIVIELSGENAARTLLKAVQDLPSSIEASVEAAKKGIHRSGEKDKEFFAAIFDSNPGMTPNVSKARHVSQIMAGDPSRGAMSVATEEEVRTGYYISFLHRPSTTPLSPALSYSSNSINFLSVKESEENQASEEGSLGETKVLSGFFGASENGIVLSRVGQGSWICDAEGATGVLSS